MLYSVLELAADPDDASAVRHALAPSAACSTSAALNPGTHLEVVSAGKWLGFRSTAAGDRFLQARKRGGQRLVFFSANVGTWEQWELADGDNVAGGAPWMAAHVTLRHRRLPQFELSVELVRVGSYSLPPHAALTSRSLLAADAAAARGTATGSAGSEVSEKQELRKMSGVLIHVRVAHVWEGWDWVAGCSRRWKAFLRPLVLPYDALNSRLLLTTLPLMDHPDAMPLQEWIQFVDREKVARQGIEARVAQVAEDAADLRAWTVMQASAWRTWARRHTSSGCRQLNSWLLVPGPACFSYQEW